MTRPSSSVAQAEEQGVSGKAVTPFLLRRIQEAGAASSGMDPVSSNVALVRHNAGVGARIAVALHAAAATAAAAASV